MKCHHNIVTQIRREPTRLPVGPALWLQSGPILTLEPGSGARPQPTGTLLASLRFFLPSSKLTVPRIRPPQIAQHSDTVGSMDVENRRILIVDDTDGIRKLLSTYFTRAGFAVRVASSGNEAAQISEDEQFDAVLSDVRMNGGMNGHDLARYIVGRWPCTAIVLMCAWDEINCEGCSGNGERCVALRKPFQPKHALAAIEEALRDSNL